MKHYRLAAAIFLVTFLTACGGGGSSAGGGGPTLVSIAVTPSNQSIGQGAALQLIATGT